MIQHSVSNNVYTKELLISLIHIVVIDSIIIVYLYPPYPIFLQGRVFNQVIFLIFCFQLAIVMTYIGITAYKILINYCASESNMQIIE